MNAGRLALDRAESPPAPALQTPTQFEPVTRPQLPRALGSLPKYSRPVACWCGGFYDQIVGHMERRCMSAWRAELLAGAHGHVLELGAGTGLNLVHYPDAVTQLTLSEPDARMRRQLESKIRNNIRKPSVLSDTAESLRLDDKSIDTVVSTLVLCSVADVRRVAAEVRRVLRSGGRWLMVEHIAAPRGTCRRRFQSYADPVWKRVAGGCHLQRDPRDALYEAGFIARSVHTREIIGVPTILRSGLFGTWMVS